MSRDSRADTRRPQQAPLWWPHGPVASRRLRRRGSDRRNQPSRATTPVIVTAWSGLGPGSVIRARLPAPAGNRGLAGRSDGPVAAAERMANVPGWLRPAQPARPPAARRRAARLDPIEPNSATDAARPACDEARHPLGRTSWLNAGLKLVRSSSSGLIHLAFGLRSNISPLFRDLQRTPSGLVQVTTSSRCF